jgi:hypothetical protein
VSDDCWCGSVLKIIRLQSYFGILRGEKCEVLGNVLTDLVTAKRSN